MAGRAKGPLWAVVVGLLAVAYPVVGVLGGAALRTSAQRTETPTRTAAAAPGVAAADATAEASAATGDGIRSMVTLRRRWTAATNAPDAEFAASLTGVAVDTLIVSVPDPIDSRAPRTFDEFVLAVEGALGQTGRVLRDHYLPWTADPATGGGPERHRDVPGELLFEKPGANHLLVMLVGESMESGIHPAALARALEDARLLRTHGGPGLPVRVALVAPVFSGSTRPLRRALEQAALRWTPVPQGTQRVLFDLVSGTATSPDNARVLAAPLPGAPADFAYHTTVVTDDVALARFLGDTKRRSTELVDADSPLVLLVEWSTYGQALQEDLSRLRGGKITVIPFPPHVSQLRSEHERQNAARRASDPAARPDPGVLDLSLDEGTNAKDTIRPFSPVTLQVEDLSLAQLLRGISAFSGGVPPMRPVYVGVLATDTKDKIYLAQQVRRYSPDAVLFFLESDLLLTHPSLRRDLMGSLVVTSYPLVSEAQRWAPGFTHDVRRQFASSGAEGLFNAVLVATSAKTGLVDYGAPRFAAFEPGPRPCVWVTAIGRNGFWPVAVFDPGTSPTLADAVPPTGSSSLVSVPLLFGLTLAAVGFVGLMFLVSRVAAVLVHSGRLPRHALAIDLLPWFDLLTPCRRGESRSVQAFWVAGLFALLASVMTIAVVFIARLVLAPADLGDAWATLVAGSLALLVLAALMVVVALAASRSIARPASRWATRFAVVGVPLLPFLLSWFYGSRDNAHSVLTAYRAIHLESGLSPLLPMWTAGIALAAFCGAGLRTVRLLDDVSYPAHVVNPVDRLGSVLGPRMDRLFARCRGWGSGRRGLRVAFLAVAVLLLVLYRPVLSRFSSALDSSGVSRGLLILVFGVLLGLLVSFLRFLQVWSQLKQLLAVIRADSWGDACLAAPVELAWSPVREFAIRAADPISPHELLRSARSLLNQLEHPVQGEALRAELGLGPDFVRDLGAAITTAERSRAAIASIGPDARDLCRCQDDLRLSLARISALLLAPLQAAGIARRLKADAVPAAVQGRPDSVCAWTLADEQHGPGVAVWIRQAREYLTLRALSFVRYVFAHLRNLLTTTVIMMLALVVIVSSYPLYPARMLGVLAWSIIVLVVVVTLWTFVQMDRDVLLSRLAGTEPGHVTMSWHFASALLSFCLVPLLVLLASVFPSVSELIGGWISPLLKTFN